jgi:hypothetical protein
MSAVRLAPASADAAIDALVLELFWISRRATSSEVMTRGWFAQDLPNCTHHRGSPLGVLFPRRHLIKVAVAFTRGAYSTFRSSVHQLAILPRRAGRKRTTTVLHHRAISQAFPRLFARPIKRPLRDCRNTGVSLEKVLVRLELKKKSTRSPGPIKNIRAPRGPQSFNR